MVLKSLKKLCQASKIFTVRWHIPKINHKEYEHVLKEWDRSEVETMKDYHNLCLKCDLLLLADVFETHRNSSLKINDVIRVIVWMHQF